MAVSLFLDLAKHTPPPWGFALAVSSIWSGLQQAAKGLLPHFISISGFGCLLRKDPPDTLLKISSLCSPPAPYPMSPHRT